MAEKDPGLYRPPDYGKRTITLFSRGVDHNGNVGVVTQVIFTPPQTLETKAGIEKPVDAKKQSVTLVGDTV